MIKKFKTIIWDFDGVIIDSDNIRTESFRETFKDFGIDSVDKLINFHLKNYFYDIVVPHSEFNSCNNKNIVKISSNNHGKILYMSRADIPYNYNNNRKILKKHLDFISFKKKALHDYCKYKITHNESVESVELLRAIENNLELGTIKINSDVFSINTKKDLILAKKIMKKCKIRKKY